MALAIPEPAGRRWPKAATTAPMKMAQSIGCRTILPGPTANVTLPIASEMTTTSKMAASMRMRADSGMEGAARLTLA
ncbi:hypothetical protein G6F32_016284 [Rhizopus arrhizus]|nr:hypothetical protein G6F32_016284 [Rhizopus arrhizus]